jgi:hypothetical protein
MTWKDLEIAQVSETIVQADHDIFNRMLFERTYLRHDSTMQVPRG